MRIDKYLAEKFGSRTKAASALAAGRVLVNGKTAAPSYEVKADDDIEILTAPESYVSAGGFKLAKALKDFDFSVESKVFADIGASNGGFTDCLLQHGAGKVFCVDVGENQLDKSIDRRKVVIIDNFNARNLTKETFGERLDGAVIDVSFISLTYILQAVAQTLEDGASVIALIKPQFECESKKVGKNGIVKDKTVHKNVILKIANYATSVNLAPVALTNAPIIEKKNKEYLILLEKNGKTADFTGLLDGVIL